MYLDMGSAFFVAMYCVVPPFHTTKFCAVPSRAIVRAQLSVLWVKKNAEHCKRRCSLHLLTISVMNAL
jgi:hypothetical protein